MSEAVATQTDPGDRLGFAIAGLTADESWDAAVKVLDYVLHVASPRAAPSPTTPTP